MLTSSWPVIVSVVTIVLVWLKPDFKVHVNTKITLNQISQSRTNTLLTQIMWLEVDLLGVLHVHHTLVHWPGSLPTAEDNEVINMIHISCNVQSSMLNCLVCDVIGQPDEGPVATSWKGAYHRLPSVNKSILDVVEFQLVWPFRRDEADSETQMSWSS